MPKYLFAITFIFAGLLMTTTSSAQRKSESSPALLRHVVMFKFKDTASKEDVKKVEDAFRALAGKISLIKDFEWGTNTSPENLNEGLTHCFLATFHSDKDRDAYLIHPDHKAFVEVLLPHLDKAMVLDYWAGK